VRFAVYVPWLFSVLLALPGLAAAVRGLPDRLDPRPVLMLLTASMAALALATTASLGLLVIAGTTDPMASGPLASPDGHTHPAALPAGLLSVVALVIAGIRVMRVLRTRARRAREIRAVVSAGEPSSPGDAAVLVEHDDVFAVATPPHGRRPGRVVVSRGMWAALDDDERAAVVAHEREHLEQGHHRHLAVGALAIALNPLLAPWWRDLVYCAERCADEGAAHRLTDRRIVARAVGRAALSARSCREPARARDLDDRTPSLGVTTGPVPRRVSALLAGWDRARRPGRHLAPALVAAVLLLSLVPLAAAGALHAAWDLGELLGMVPAP
jgi:peptidase M48-like protein